MPIDPHRVKKKTKDGGTAQQLQDVERKLKSMNGILGKIGQGATITGATVQSSADPVNYYPGIVYDKNGLRAYNAAGVVTMTINAANGGVTVDGTGGLGPTGAGAITVTGGGAIQTNFPGNNPRIAMDNNNGIQAFNAIGTRTFQLDLAGNLTVTGSSIITGGTFQTGASDPKVIFDVNGLRATDAAHNNIVNLTSSGTFSLTTPNASLAVTATGLVISSAAAPTSGARVVIDANGIRGWNATDTLGSPHFNLNATTGLIQATGVLQNTPGSTVPWQTTGFFIGGGNLLSNASAEDPTTTTQALYMNNGAGVTAGTFTLKYGTGTVTASINWNATASAVQTALNAAGVLPTGVTAACAGGPLPGSAIGIVLSGLANPAASIIAINSQSLTGGSVICGSSPNGWQTDGGTTGFLDFISQGTAFHGGNVFRLTSSASSSSPYLHPSSVVGPYGLVPGTSYTLSAYYKSASTVRTAQTFLYWRDAGGNNISGLASGGLNLTQNWQRLTLTAVVPPVGTRQQVAIAGAPTGGSFTLTYAGQTTAAIPWNAPATGAGSVAAALHALSNVGPNGIVDVWCTGGPLPTTPVVISFAYPLVSGQGAIAMMTHTDSLTGGSSPQVTLTDQPPVSMMPVIAVNNATSAGEVFYVDAVQLECADAPTAFAPRPDEIVANTVQANMINVASLSAINANLGNIVAGTLNAVTITGSTVTGGTVSTASGTGARVSMSGASNQFQVINSSNVAQVTLDGTNGLQFVQGTGPLNSVEWVNAGLPVGTLYSYGDNTHSSMVLSTNDTGTAKTSEIVFSTNVSGVANANYILAYCAGVQAMVLQSDGTSDFAWNTHYARRFHNAAWGPTASGTWYQLIFDTNDGGDTARWNGSGQYVVPVAGQYRVVASWGVPASAAGALYVGIGRGSQERIAGATFPSGLSSPIVMCTGTMSCAANDVISAYAMTAGSFNKQTQFSNYTCCYMEVTRVG